jgi:hypothetical protein
MSRDGLYGRPARYAQCDRRINPRRSGLPRLPRFGIRLSLRSVFQEVSWYGLVRGSLPGHAAGARTGIWRRRIDEMEEPRIFPQENGFARNPLAADA